MSSDTENIAIQNSVTKNGYLFLVQLIFEHIQQCVAVEIKCFLSAPLRRIGGVELYLHSSFTTTLVVGDCLTSPPDRFATGKVLGYPLNSRFGVAQNRFRRFAEKKNFPCLDAKPGPFIP